MEISNVSADDGGEYRVTAKNNLGESNANLTLNFDMREYIYRFSVILKDYWINNLFKSIDDIFWYIFDLFWYILQ